MKILYLHNYYRFRGGEDISFELDVDMLRDYGHDVVTVTRHNDDIDGVSRLRVAVETIYNRRAYHEMQSLLDEHQPDLVHCNNLFPQFSHSVVLAAKARGVPVVQALRNYRSMCANSYLYRDEETCERCRGRRVALPAIRHACYRDSRIATAVVVAMQAVQRKARKRGQLANAYITPSEFARRLHIEEGFPSDRIFARPNFVHPDPGLGGGEGNYAVFVGRLSPEKGIETVLQTWKEFNIACRLVIVGTGPLEASIRQTADTLGNVEILGECDQARVFEIIGDAAFLIMASQWYETFGRTIAEAFSKGTPVIAAGFGAMAELIDHEANGLLIEPGNRQELAEGVERLSALGPVERSRFRHAARSAFEKKFTRESSYRRLMKIYSHATI